MATSHTQNQHSSMSRLFSRYMNGQINDMTWTNLMRLIDADGLSRSERLAFARFVNDVVEESGPGALRMPKLKEVQDLYSSTRH